MDISGGNRTSNFFSLDTIIEEISHTVQFIQVWDSLTRDPILEAVGMKTTGYGAAKRRWGARYLYYGAKALGYDNDVERRAKKRTAEIVTSLRANAPRTDQHSAGSGYIKEQIAVE